MLKINVEAHCGNAPRKEVLRDFTIAFATGDHALILENIADDIHWNLVGEQRIVGKDAFAQAISAAPASPTQELTITNIITHGNTAAVNGTLVFADGKTFSFCDVYNFSGASKRARIKEMTSYSIEIRQ